MPENLIPCGFKWSKQISKIGENYFVRKKNRLNLPHSFFKKNTMNKAELISTLADEAGITKTQANTALDAFIGAVTKTLKKGDKVTLVGFGTFRYLSVPPAMVATHKPAKLSKSKREKLHVLKPVKNFRARCKQLLSFFLKPLFTGAFFALILRTFAKTK